MNSENVSYIGPPSDDLALLDELPTDLADVLRQTNGFIASNGAIHLRGAVQAPAWHSLRAAWRGPESFAVRYRSVRPADIPFAQDALGDQYLLRDDGVWHLCAEADEVFPFAKSLAKFLDASARDPVRFLTLGPLVEFWDQGGTLEPGQLLSVYPPLIMRKDVGGYSYRAVSVGDRFDALATFAAQVRDLPDGATITLSVRERVDEVDP